MPLTKLGLYQHDTPPIDRPGVQDHDREYFEGSRVPPEHPERAAKGDLSMVHVPDMPSRASFEGQGAPAMRAWDGASAQAPTGAPFVIGMKAPVHADTSDVPKSVQFKAGLPVTSRIEPRKK